MGAHAIYNTTQINPLDVQGVWELGLPLDGNNRQRCYELYVVETCGNAVQR